MIKNTKTSLAYYRLGVLFLIALSAFLAIQYIHLSGKNIAILKEKDSFKIEKELVLQYFWQRIFVSPDNVTLDIVNDSVLHSITGDSHLGLWISDKHCSECVDFALTKLLNLPDQVKSRVIIFSDYENPRLRKIINEKISGGFYVIDYRFYNKGTLHNAPLFGIVSPKLGISKIFFPAKELPLLTDYYLSKIISCIH